MTYLAVQAALLVAAALVEDPARLLLIDAVVAVGTVIFSAALIVRRPRPTVAWAFFAAAAWALIAAGVTINMVTGVATRAAIATATPAVLALVANALQAIGLALLARAVARPGPVDGLDAGMVSLAGFLLLWTFAIRPVFVETPLSTAAAVVLPTSMLLLATLAVRLALGGGLRDLTMALVVADAAVLVGLGITTLIPLVSTHVILTTTTSAFAFAAHGLVLGGIGLMPSLTRSRQSPEAATADLTLRRLALFEVLAMAPLVAWADEVLWRRSVQSDAVASAVPIAASATFVVLLGVRLTMLVRLSQRRSNALLQRMAEQAALQEQLAFQASHDPLTGLANRKALTERLDRLQSHPGVSHALLMLDLDGFKRINDEHGHAAGDSLLVQVAQRLRAAAPPHATVARLGGDEFVVLAEDMDGPSAKELAERIIDGLRSVYSINGSDASITTSIGVVVMPAQAGPAYEQPLRNADLALYQAKASGKNRIVVAD